MLELARDRLASGDAAAALELLQPGGAAPAGAEPIALPRGSEIDAVRGMALLACNDAGGAADALTRAIANGDVSDATKLNLALALDRLGEGRRARDLMRSVAVAAPLWDEPLLRLAESFRFQGETEESVAAYRRALACRPDRVESLIGCAALLIGSGCAAEAQEMLRRAVDLAPDNPDGWDALGLATMLLADPAGALSAFHAAHRVAPRRFEPALHIAEAAIASNCAGDELVAVDGLLLSDPANPAMQLLRGLLLDHLGRRPEAIDALDVAAALAPSAAIPVALLGGMLARSLRLAEANTALQRALQIDPDNLRVRADLGAVLMRIHKPAEACLVLHELLRRSPPQFAVLCNLANATAGCGKQDEAVELARQAIALNPSSPLTWRTLLGTLPYTEDVDGAAMLRAARDCAARMPAAAFDAGRPEDIQLGARRVLRIGLLSGSFRTHPVGWLTVAGLETLAPEMFELIFFSQNTGTDPITRRFRAIASDWVDIDGVDDAGVADRIRAAEIEILIDLGGYGEGGRMAVCALRPAPVQIKWVGMQCHSTGLPAMDWFLSDRWETPEALAHTYSERILRLPDGYVCYSPPPTAPNVAPLPALSNGFVTFGCFNNLAKITPRVLATWASILHLLPTARLVLKSPQLANAGTAASMQQAMQQHGIAPDRFTTQGPSRHRAFLAEYNNIDIALDPFPYSGGLTTCEALWMGIPTITLPGETFASRHSLSHLSNVGLGDWAVSDVAGYVEQAVGRAGDLPALAALRAGLRARVKASPLCDAPRFGANLGAALQFAWEQRAGPVQSS